LAPTAELAQPEELQEAAFCIIKAAQPASSRVRPYHDQYLRWMREGAGEGEAYTQRAAIYIVANCFLQVGFTF